MIPSSISRKLSTLLAWISVLYSTVNLAFEKLLHSAEESSKNEENSFAANRNSRNDSHCLTDRKIASTYTDGKATYEYSTTYKNDSKKDAKKKDTYVRKPSVKEISTYKSTDRITVSTPSKASEKTKMFNNLVQVK